MTRLIETITDTYGRPANCTTSPRLDELLRRAQQRTATGEWTADPMTPEHFETSATIFHAPVEEETRLFDNPAV
jgi:hypothetical protein